MDILTIGVLGALAVYILWRLAEQTEGRRLRAEAAASHAASVTPAVKQNDSPGVMAARSATELAAMAKGLYSVDYAWPAQAAEPERAQSEPFTSRWPQPQLSREQIIRETLLSLVEDAAAHADGYATVEWERWRYQRDIAPILRTTPEIDWLDAHIDQPNMVRLVLWRAATPSDRLGRSEREYAAG